MPTELGITVTHLMKEYFEDIVNLTFTAEMEEKLDKVADGETDWVKLLESFYGGFKKGKRFCPQYG